MTHDLEALKGLIAAATPGPWFVVEPSKRNPRSVQVFHAGDDLNHIAKCDDQMCFHDRPRNIENAALIAAARTALPELVERVETATATIEGLRGEVERLKAQRDEREELLLTLHDALSDLFDRSMTESVTNGIRAAIYLIRSRPALSPSTTVKGA